MVDPFLDPLDTAPIQRPVPFIPSRDGNTETNTQETFQNVLSREVEQEPTPLLTPDALRVPTPQSKTTPFSSGTTPVIPVKQNVNPTALSPSTSKQETQPVRQESPTPPPTAPTVSSGMNSKQNLADILNLRIQGNPVQETLQKEPPREPRTDPVTRTPEIQEPARETNSLPPQTLYTIQRGDTLSEIVASAMNHAGIEYSVSDLYRMVRSVASQNGLANPDRIFAGNTVDLSSIYSGEIISQAEQPAQFSWAAGVLTPAYGAITSEFGNRTHPVLNEERFHNGIDIAVNIGTPIYPMKTGVVIFSGEKTGYGQVVEVDHGDGIVSVYGHLSDRRVSVGDTVNPKNVVGLSGDTGLTTGPHLHFEIRNAGRPIDPLTVLTRAQIENPPDQIVRADLP